MGYHFSSWLTATLNLCLIYFKITWTLAILLEHMHKKFEINQTKIKGGCQSGRKVVTHNSKSDLPLALRLSLSSFWSLAMRAAGRSCVRPSPVSPCVVVVAFLALFFQGLWKPFPLLSGLQQEIVWPWHVWTCVLLPLILPHLHLNKDTLAQNTIFLKFLILTFLFAFDFTFF